MPLIPQMVETDLTIWPACPGLSLGRSPALMSSQPTSLGLTSLAEMIADCCVNAGLSCCGAGGVVTAAAAMLRPSMPPVEAGQRKHLLR